MIVHTDASSESSEPDSDFTTTALEDVVQSTVNPN